MRLNYTGRRRIPRGNVRLRLKESPGELLLAIETIDLHELRLPFDAKVIIEAYRQTTRQRVACGTVSSLQVPMSVHLAGFEVGDGLLFRVKVVGVGEADGLLLAAADRVRAVVDDDDGSRLPILPFRPSEDLGQLLWRLDTSEEPTVLINAAVGDWKSFALDLHFQALIYPEVVRRCALWLLGDIDAADDPDGPAEAWRRFFAELGKDPLTDPPDDGQHEEWADEAAMAFARRHRFRDRLVAVMDAEV